MTLFPWNARRPLTLLFGMAILAGAQMDSRSAESKLVYPPSCKADIADNYHGTIVRDPYRWLEDENSPATRAWVESQNQLTFAFLKTIPQRAAIQRRLTRLWNYEKFGVPVKEGGRYFFLHNSGLQNQPSLYVLNSPDSKPVLLLDPNTLSTDGTVSLAGWSVSHDGNLLAYGLARAGSDWEEWRVRVIGTGTDLPDEINWVKFSSASWTRDGRGFYYSRYNAPEKEGEFSGVNYFHKLYYHELGTPQSMDRLVYHRPDHKDWDFSGNVTDDGSYLVITVSQGTDRRKRVYCRDLQNPDAPVVELLNDFDADYRFVDNDGPVFYFQTDLNAPRGRVIAVDVEHAARANWREIVPESGDSLEQVSLVNDQLICVYLKDARSVVKVFGIDGKWARDVELPGIGSAGGFGGKREDTETFYSFTSFTAPGTIYHYDPASGKSEVFRTSKALFNPDEFETKQVFYPGKDGTNVPMFIVSKKGVKLDGNNPTVLYGYGGFDISTTPGFSPAIAGWLEMGGVYAVANIRGGGEYGEDWHQAGMKLKKQTVFDDFIAAGEWLVANHYTRPAKLAISGRSNGGLLVGACLTQRPDLFGAALPTVGVMDMLRFPKFTIGWAWTSEYGSPEVPREFAALYAYSPLHNIKPGTHYPATLITTGDHDDRVVPGHSFKFAASLQAAQSGGKPILIRIDTRAGHGAGKPTAKQIEEAADKWAFLARELGMNPKNPGDGQ